MSIEIRTYEGTAEDLSRFILQAWLDSYREQMVVPDWSPAYFDWQMTGPEIPGRDYLISAWKDDKLVGTLLAMPFRMWYLGEEVEGAQGSWLTVLPEVRREGVAKKMAKEVAQRQQEKNCLARIGYAFHGSRRSLGPRFWKKAKENTNFIRPVRLWARVLDSRAIQDWTNEALDRTVLKILPNSVCDIGSVSPDVTIRDYQPTDLDTCLELINKQARKADLAILWESEQLQRQLKYGDFVNTLIVERNGEVVGFLNYHKLKMHLRGTVWSAIIDLLACEELTGREVRSLLNHFCRRMKTEDVKLILMREFANQPTAALLRTRFIPKLSDSTLLLSRSDPEIDLRPREIRKIQVLWR